ncbi:hypothetical protein PV10_06013 [Exophiala mesophila]|uniref:Uncharacterized protein n=1 Tax=Exophiala mesophila TaxID=212818 RepID=A0A0D1Z9W2_EXOME|nr:uncharacterized protein PV10_06013 [Exophiala mesophila]KIV91477.1 hypothetical protein PV10_06013 [Exophiala mesophila]
MTKPWPQDWQRTYPLPEVGAPAGTQHANGTITGATPAEVMLNIISFLTPVPERENDLFSDREPVGGWHARNVVHAHRGAFRIAMAEDFTSMTTFLIDRKDEPTNPGPTIFLHSTRSSEGFAQYLRNLSPEKASQIRHIALIDYNTYITRPTEPEDALKIFERRVLRPFMHKMALESVGIFHCMRCYRMNDRWFGPFAVNHWPSQTEVHEPNTNRNSQGSHWMEFEISVKSMTAGPGRTTVNDFNVERTSTRKGPYPQILRSWQDKRVDILANALGVDWAPLRSELDNRQGDSAALYEAHNFPDPAPDDGIGDPNDPMNPTTRQMAAYVRHVRLIFRRKRKITQRDINRVQRYWRRSFNLPRPDLSQPRYNLRARQRPHSYANPGTRAQQQASMIV